jgi:hypothetical protein
MLIKKLIVFLVIFFKILLISAQDLKKLTIVLKHLPQKKDVNSSFFLAANFNN